MADAEVAKGGRQIANSFLSLYDARAMARAVSKSALPLSSVRQRLNPMAADTVTTATPPSKMSLIAVMVTGQSNGRNRG